LQKKQIFLKPLSDDIIKMIVKLLVDGGEMKPSPAISQKLGPLGINLGKIMQDVNKSTASFKGMKVPVVLDIDTKTKNFKVEVQTPPASELIKKEISAEKGSGTPNTIKIGNLAIEQIVAIAKVKQQGMLVNDFKSAVNSILGTCVSLGILVDNKDPKEIIQEIDSNEEYAEIISRQATEVSEEKRKALNEYFAKVKAKQDEFLKKKAEEEAAKEAEKAAAAATAPAPAAGTPGAAKTAAPAPEAKKAPEKAEKK
jgi:large subunit ribosomal protein L11